MRFSADSGRQQMVPLGNDLIWRWIGVIVGRSPSL
jgi:hypothetical protein